MPPVSHFRYIVRALLCFCVYFVMQLPESYGVRIDKDTFIQSFTMENDGQRINSGPWELGPGHTSSERAAWDDEVRELDGNTDKARAESWARWDNYREKVAHHIPLVIANGRLQKKASPTAPKTKSKSSCGFTIYRRIHSHALTSICYS